MKRSTLILTMIVAVVVVLAVEAVGEEKIERAPLTWQQAALGDGEALYAELCAVCHGADAKGNGPASPALAAPAPGLTQLALHNDGVFPAAEVEKTITGETRVVAHGTLEMPMWGTAFKDARPDFKPGRREGVARLRILALTTYLESIQEE